jgi:hypothetical protein
MKVAGSFGRETSFIFSLSNYNMPVNTMPVENIRTRSALEHPLRANSMIFQLCAG